MADAAEEVLKQWEAQCGENSDGGSGTQRLVRTACKSFHHRGCQKSGTSLLFRTYLKKQGLVTMPLAQFVGNRFNILFYDSAGVFYLRTHMEKFIESAHGSNANLLLKSVLRDLKNPLFISGCRALGLVDKVITGPLWRKIQESSISVLQMGSVYCELKEKFDSWSLNVQEVVNGNAILESAKDIHVDEVWDESIKEQESSVSTQELLQLLFSAFAITTQRLLIDHLPGGKYDVDTTLSQETASVPPTNVAPERDFAVLDRILREKPNASLVALESLILYSHNKTSQWLQEQKAEDKERLIKAARALAPSIKAKFKARQEEIQRRHEEALVLKEQAIAKKKARELMEKEKLTVEIGKVGMWTNKAEVIRGLDAVSKKSDKLKLLKLQINFRRKVLCQTHSDPSVFRFSHNGKQHSVDQLKENLFCLLPSVVTADDDPPSVLTLADVLECPEQLVGERINHRFEVDGELIWYEGTVESYNSHSKEYLIAYDGEEDLCSFPLLEDIASGDLTIIH